MTKDLTEQSLEEAILAASKSFGGTISANPTRWFLLATATERINAGDAVEVGRDGKTGMLYAFKARSKSADN